MSPKGRRFSNVRCQPSVGKDRVYGYWITTTGVTHTMMDFQPDVEVMERFLKSMTIMPPMVKYDGLFHLILKN